MLAEIVGLLTDGALVEVLEVGSLTDVELTVLDIIELETELELLEGAAVELERVAEVESAKYGTQPGRLKSAPVFPELPYTMQLWNY